MSNDQEKALAQEIFTTMMRGCPHGMGDTMTGCSECYNLLDGLIKLAHEIGEGYQEMSNAIQNNKVH